MHKDFYASGFLFHLPTQQILLQQQKNAKNASPTWSLFVTKSKAKEDEKTAFRRIIHKTLKVKLSLKDIEPIYVYFDEGMDRNNSLLYGKVGRVKNFPSKKGISFSWFTFKQVLKLPVDEQTKHDIVVGQRVVASKARKLQGLQTLE